MSQETEDELRNKLEEAIQISKRTGKDCTELTEALKRMKDRIKPPKK